MAFRCTERFAVKTTTKILLSIREIVAILLLLNNNDVKICQMYVCQVSQVTT